MDAAGPTPVPGPGPVPARPSREGRSPARPARAAGVRAAAVAALAASACRDPQAGPAKLSGHDRLPLYRVAVAAGPVIVDGRLDEPAWRDALQMPLSSSIHGSPPRRPTVAKLLRDGRHLYVAFECGGDPASEEDLVEVLLDPPGAGRGWVGIGVSRAGARLDHRPGAGEGGEAPGPAVDPDAAFAVRRERAPDGEGVWTAELALPLDGLRGGAPPPRAGTRWRARLRRLERRDRLALVEEQTLGWILFDR